MLRAGSGQHRDHCGSHPGAGHPRRAPSSQRPVYFSSTLASTQRSGATVKGDKGAPCPALPPKQSEVSSPARRWKPLAGGGCAAGKVSQPAENEPSPAAACPRRGSGSARRGLVLRAAPALRWVPLPMGQRWGSALGISAGNQRSGARGAALSWGGCKPSSHLRLLPSQTKGEAKGFSNKRTQNTTSLQVSEEVTENRAKAGGEACWRLSGL